MTERKFPLNGNEKKIKIKRLLIQRERKNEPNDSLSDSSLPSQVLIIYKR